MVSAIVCGILGVVLGIAVGHLHLGLPIASVVHAIIATDVSGFVAVMFITQSQNIFWFRKFFIPGAISTWIVFLIIYIGGTWVLGPPGIGLREYAFLSVPLILSTGFTIIVFGPIQDRIVRWRQAAVRAGVKK